MRRRETGLAVQGAKLGASAAVFASGIIERYGKALASDDPLGSIFAMLAEDASALFTAVSDKIKAAMDELFEEVKDPVAKGVFGGTSDEVGQAMIAMAADMKFIASLFNPANLAKFLADKAVANSPTVAAVGGAVYGALPESAQQAATELYQSIE